MLALLPSCDTPSFSVHPHSYFEVLHVLNHVDKFNILWQTYFIDHVVYSSIDRQTFVARQTRTVPCPGSLSPVSVVGESRCPESRSVKALRSAIPFFSLKSQAQSCLNLSTSLLLHLLARKSTMSTAPKLNVLMCESPNYLSSRLIHLSGRRYCE